MKEDEASVYDRVRAYFKSKQVNKESAKRAQEEASKRKDEEADRSQGEIREMRRVWPEVREGISLLLREVNSRAFNNGGKISAWKTISLSRDDARDSYLTGPDSISYGKPYTLSEEWEEIDLKVDDQVLISFRGNHLRTRYYTEYTKIEVIGVECIVLKDSQSIRRVLDPNVRFRRKKRHFELPDPSGGFYDLKFNQFQSEWSSSGRTPADFINNFVTGPSFDPKTQVAMCKEALLAKLGEVF